MPSPQPGLSGAFTVGAIGLLKETPTTAAGTNGIYTELDWSPSATVPTGGYGIFGFTSNVNVNMDGQGTADATPLGALFGITANSNTTALGSITGSYSVSQNYGNANIGTITANQFYAVNGGTGASTLLAGNSGIVEVDSGTVGTGADYLAEMYIDGGATNNIAGFLFDGQGGSGFTAGTISSIAGFQYISPAFGITPTYNYGIALGDVSGGTNNFAIQTGLGLNSFGDNIQQSLIVATSALPACASGTLLMRAAVNDATSATPGTALVGSGTYTIAVQCIYHSAGTVYSWIID